MAIDFVPTFEDEDVGVFRSDFYAWSCFFDPVNF